jgi:uncharacterized protein YkwD
MRKILFILFVLVSNLSYGQKPTDKINVNKINIELLEKLILEEINNYRVNYSYLEKIPNTTNHYRKIKDPKQKLILSIYQINSSRLHSQKMVDLDQGLFHDEKDDRNYNENCTMASIGISTEKTYIQISKRVFEQWKDSRLHNINLLSTSIKYGEVGVAKKYVSEISFGKTYYGYDFYITFRGYVN